MTFKEELKCGFLGIMWAAFIGMLVFGCIVNPQPTPANTQAVAAKAMRDYVTGLAKVATDCADQMKAGKLTTKEERIAFVKEGRLNVEDAAYAPLHTLLDTDDSEGTYRFIAAGYREVLK